MRGEKETVKKNLRATGYIMSSVLTITRTCVAKVHLYRRGHPSTAFSSYYLLSCVCFVPPDSSFQSYSSESDGYMCTCHGTTSGPRMWKIKSDPGCCDCSLLIKSAALFLCTARC